MTITRIYSSTMSAQQEGVDMEVRVSGTVPPLESDVVAGEVSKKSDHKIAFVQSSIEKVRAFQILSYSYRYYNAECELEYGRWLAAQRWEDVTGAEGSNGKANAYQKLVGDALERIFPLVTVRRKLTDPPWYNAKIRKRITQKKGIYRREGRSPKWRKIKKLLEDLVER